MGTGICAYLEPNALYIATQPLVSGKFRWSFLLADDYTTGTRHRWHEDTSIQAPQFVEQYSTQLDVNPASEKPAYLGYFKVTGFVRPQDTSVFAEICRNTFSTSYCTIEQNRASGIDNRPWLFGVLGTLWAKGFIIGRDCDLADGLLVIEKDVTMRSQDLEGTYLQAYLFQRKYVTVIEVI